MWNRPLFRNGVIYSLAGVLIFRLNIAAMAYIIAANASKNSKIANDPPLLVKFLFFSSLLMALGGVIAIVVSLIIGDKSGRENSNLQ